MKKTVYLIILLFFVFSLSSCKDFWHPEEAKKAKEEAKKANYATVIVKLTIFGIGHYGCYNLTLHDESGTEYQLGYLSSGSYYYYSSYFTQKTQTDIKVPAGTYYLTAIAFNSTGIIRSSSFTVAEKTTKIIYYDNGEFLVE